MKVWPGGQKLPTRQLANPLRKNASLFHRYDEGPKWAPTDMLCKPPGNAIFQGRDKDPETVPAIQSADCRDKMRAQIAASFGAIRNEPGNLCLRKTAWWGWEDSNLQPNDYQPPALSIEHSGSRALTAVSDRAFS